jgi:lipoprotein-releasing system permease protein
VARLWPTRLERRIAFRYLRGQRGTRSATLQTAVAMGGIGIGVMALIFVLGVMNGLATDLRNRILVASPDLRVLTYGAGMTFDDWRKELALIRGDTDVVAAAPEVATQGLIENSSGYSEGVFVSGVEPGVGVRQVTGLDTTAVRGDFRFRTTLPDVDGAVVLGARLADRLSVFPGDTVLMTGPQAIKQNRGLGVQTPHFWVYEVTGIFETGMFIYDNSYVVMSRAAAQDFAGIDSAVTDIAVRLRSPDQTPAVGARLETRLGYPYRIQTWQEQNSGLFSALKLEKLAMGAVIFFIIIVAAFNIVGTLAMVVTFKTREIGILQAMGLTPRGVGRVFLMQGAVVGLVGTGIGMVFGLALSYLVDKSGLIPIDPSVYFIDHLPVHVEARDVVVVVGASLLVAILATIGPSRWASQLQPVEAIRAE